MNNKIVCCFLDFKSDKFVHDSVNDKTFGVKTKLVVDPITMHLAQGVVRPSLSVMVGVEFFCRGIQLSSF
jgi:hypothetical protein